MSTAAVAWAWMTIGDAGAGLAAAEAAGWLGERWVTW